MGYATAVLATYKLGILTNLYFQTIIVGKIDNNRYESYKIRVMEQSWIRFYLTFSWR